MQEKNVCVKVFHSFRSCSLTFLFRRKLKAEPFNVFRFTTASNMIKQGAWCAYHLFSMGPLKNYSYSHFPACSGIFYISCFTKNKRPDRQFKWPWRRRRPLTSQICIFHCERSWLSYGALAMMTATARKTSLENKHFRTCDFFDHSM